MKRSLLGLSLVGLTFMLGACSSDLNGTWVRAKGTSPICRTSFTFTGSNTFTVHDSFAQGGNTYTGTYKHLQDDQYLFNYGNLGYNTFTIDMNGNTADINLTNDSGKCEYVKQN